MIGAMEKTLAWIAGVGLLIMMLLTFVDVIGRYLFHNSIFGTAEYIEILMVFTVFSGLAFITTTNDHITVTIFEGWIARRIPNVQRWATLAFSVVVYAIIAMEMWAHTIQALENNRRTAVLDMPQAILPAAAAVFSTVGVFLFVIAIFRTRGRPETLTPVAHEPGEGVS